MKQFLLILLALALLTSAGMAASGAGQPAQDAFRPPKIVPTPKPTPEPTPEPTPVPSNCILLQPEEEIWWTCGQVFRDPGWLADGSEGEDRSAEVTVEGKVNFCFVGDYELNYQIPGEDGPLAQATRLVHVIPAELPEVVHRDKTIYLTFDDGPCENTPYVLDVLAKYDVKATFFVICGRKDADLQLLPRIVEEGHTLGIHCYQHKYELIYRSPQAYADDLTAAQEVIFNYTGQYAQVIRFPGGSTTAQGLSLWFPDRYDGVREMIHNMGLRYYDWDVQPEIGRSTEGVLSNFINPSQPYDGAIVLQHDTRGYSVRALEGMIQWGLENGYTFAAIDLTTPEYHAN